MPKIQIYADRAGQFRWRLIAGNGEIVASGESYMTKDGAIRAANLVKQLASLALLEDTTIRRI